MSPRRQTKSAKRDPSSYMCIARLSRSSGEGRGGSLYNITAHTLFHLPSCRPASVLCSSDFVRVELRDTITVIELSKGVVFCGRVSTFTLAPPKGTTTPFLDIHFGSPQNKTLFLYWKLCWMLDNVKSSDVKDGENCIISLLFRTIHQIGLLLVWSIREE